MDTNDVPTTGPGDTIDDGDAATTTPGASGEGALVLTSASGRVRLELPAGTEVTLHLGERDGGPLTLTQMACELLELSWDLSGEASGRGGGQGGDTSLGELELPDEAVVRIDGEDIGVDVALELLASAVVRALRDAVERTFSERA